MNNFINLHITEETEKFIIKHMKLVHHICHKYEDILYKYPGLLSYDDLVAEGYLALWRAYLTFDPTKKVSWGTYAYKVINNQILMLFRNNRPKATSVSLYQPIEGLDGDEHELIDILPDKNDLKEEYRVLIDEVMSLLSDRERRIVQAVAAGYNQMEIARSENLSQGHISKILTAIRTKANKFIQP